MTDHGGKITVSNNQLIISSFKPKVVEMHCRDHLERFREAAVATGIGLNWTQWRFTVEVGSALYLELVKIGEISSDKALKIKEEILGAAAYSGKTTGTVVKMEPTQNIK